MSEREAPDRFYVYVIELDDSKRKNGQPAVYVGQSVKTPDERFKDHMEGHKASRHVRGHGVGLLPNLYERYNPFATRAEAEAMEVRLAKDLRRNGRYTVYGGH